MPSLENRRVPVQRNVLVLRAIPPRTSKHCIGAYLLPRTLRLKNSLDITWERKQQAILISSDRTSGCLLLCGSLLQQMQPD